MAYLETACKASKKIFKAIGKIEKQHLELLQSADDPEVLLDFPCESMEDYTAQTGKPITFDNYDVIIILNALYNALYELDCGIGSVSKGEETKDKVYFR